MLPSVNDADGNPDGDEFNNLAEYVGGGNPNNGTKPALVVGAPVPAASDFAGAFTPSTMSGSAIASDGTNFLIVSCKQDVAGGLGVFGILISETGRVGSNFQISADLCPQQPAVAFDGTNYLVVVARGGQLFGISVTPAGVSNPPGKPITSNVGNSFPSIVFDGENYLVAWHNFSGSSSIRGARVNKAGDVLDAEFPISSVGNESAPMVAFGATNYLVVWSNQTTGSENVFGALVPKAGAVVAPAAFPIANGVDSQVAGGVAFDGTNYLVVWDHQPGTGGGQIAARRVTPDGTLLPDGRADTAGITITAPTGNHSSSVAFAGSTFVVTWARGGSSPSQGPAGVFAARVSKAGDQIDFALQDSGVTVSGSPAFTRFFHPVIASKGQSQNALIAWIRNDDLGTLNDVLAAPVISP
jgi:hypothetical protein